MTGFPEYLLTEGNEDQFEQCNECHYWFPLSVMRWDYRVTPPTSYVCGDCSSVIYWF